MEKIENPQVLMDFITTKHETTKFKNPQDLIAFLKTLDEEVFDMTNTEATRSDACCIAGWVNIINGRESGAWWAQGLIDLFDVHLYGEVIELAAYNGENFDRKNATPKQAARVLEILLETGRADWARARREA